VARVVRAGALAGALTGTLAGALTLNLAGCRTETPPSPDRVATLGGVEITFAQFEAYLEQHLGEPGRGLASDVLSRLFDQFLEEKLLVRLAVDRGLVPPGTGRRAAIDRLLAAEEIEAPGDAEIAAYYRAHRDDFARPERVRLRQILVEDRPAADRAVAELRAGADFDAVARRVGSTAGVAAGSSGPGGELARDDLPPAFAEAIFRLRPGEISDVVEADYGFHVFQVVERLPAQVVPLEAAAGEIRDRLHERRADECLAELVAEARSRYNVVVYERNLPFNYQGLHIADPP
jgi:parvulin-like peptidyl-prolyl isomerase